MRVLAVLCLNCAFLFHTEPSDLPGGWIAWCSRGQGALMSSCTPGELPLEKGMNLASQLPVLSS